VYDHAARNTSELLLPRHTTLLVADCVQSCYHDQYFGWKGGRGEREIERHVVFNDARICKFCIMSILDGMQCEYGEMVE